MVGERFADFMMRNDRKFRGGINGIACHGLFLPNFCESPLRVYPNEMNNPFWILARRQCQGLAFTAFHCVGNQGPYGYDDYFYRSTHDARQPMAILVFRKSHRWAPRNWLPSRVF